MYLLTLISCVCGRGWFVFHQLRYQTDVKGRSWSWGNLVDVE